MTEAPALAAGVVDLGALATWMDAQSRNPALGAGPIERADPVGGGTQNVMLRVVRREGPELILRRGPTHLRPRSNDALRREIQVLGALQDTSVRCPRIVAACTDEDVLGGAVFYLMEPVDGFNASVTMPVLHAESRAVRHAMGLDAVDALAKLHAVDHVAVGLGGVGRPEGFLERQVPRWLGELESYSRHDGYPGPDLPGLDEVAAWLDARRPGSFAVGLVHGDYHLQNLMFSFDGPQVAAIVDWEMCTVGDPLLDLGWLIATWPDADAGDAAVAGALSVAGGLPPQDELVGRYAASSARDLGAIDWYVVLACFKLAVILEGTHARACAGKAPVEIGDRLHATAVALLARAMRVIERAPA